MCLLTYARSGTGTLSSRYNVLRWKAGVLVLLTQRSPVCPVKRFVKFIYLVDQTTLSTGQSLDAEACTHLFLKHFSVLFFLL